MSVAARHAQACPPPPGLEQAAAAARARWGRWERESPCVLLAVLAPDGDGFTFGMIAKGDKRREVRYDARRGLSLAR